MVEAKDALADRPGVDSTRHTSTQRFEVTVDRQGDIYRAYEYDATVPPDAPNAQEWSRAGSYDARRLDGLSVATRGTVDCGGNRPPGSRCGEVRTRLFAGIDGTMSDEDEYSSTRGVSEDDANLPLVATSAGVDAPSGQPTATGSLVAALEPWQRPPPGHGSQYERYDLTESGHDSDGEPQTVTRQLWIDATTQRPVRVTARTSTGTVLGTTYWAYEANRLRSTEAAADLFTLTPPVAPSARDDVEHGGTAPFVAPIDTETGAVFTPRWVQTPLLIGSEGLCLTSTERRLYNETDDEPTVTGPEDPELTPEAFGPRTTVDAYYRFRSPSADCADVPIDVEAEDDLTITSYSAQSTEGLGWLSAYEGAVADYESHPGTPGSAGAGRIPVQVGGPTAPFSTALVVPYSETDTAFVVSASDTVYTVKGAFTAADVPAIALAMGEME